MLFRSRVTKLSAEGQIWFNRKVNDPSLKEDFLEEEEKLEKKGRGVDRLLLPQPWADVTLGLIKYITCEGRSTIIFNYHFHLLNHLRHQNKINLPYLLLGNIKHMAAVVKTTTHPKACVTNHELIKFIVLDALSQQGRSWEEFKRKMPRKNRRKLFGTLEGVM